MPNKPASDDPTEPTPADSQPLGFNLDITDLLRGVGAAAKPRRRTSSSSRSTTARSRSTGTGGMDDAVRRAVRAELQDVEKALRDLADEVVRLRKAHEDLLARIEKASRR